MVFCVDGANFEKIPIFLKRIFKVLTYQPFLLWLMTSFLVLCYAGWQPTHFWIYILPGLPYAMLSLTISHLISDLSELDSRKVVNWAIILIIGALFGVASILLLTILERFSAELLFFNVLYSVLGFALGYSLMNIGILGEKLNNYGINLTIFAKFLAGNLVGLGINIILS